LPSAICVCHCSYINIVGYSVKENEEYDAEINFLKQHIDLLGNELKEIKSKSDRIDDIERNMKVSQSTENSNLDMILHNKVLSFCSLINAVIVTASNQFR